MVASQQEGLRFESHSGSCTGSGINKGDVKQGAGEILVHIVMITSSTSAAQP